MPTFQEFVLDDNDDKDSESHMGQKANNKREEEQEIPILCSSQKVNTREEKHLIFKTQKTQKVIFTTCIHAKNKPKSLNSCFSKELTNAIRE